LENVLDTLKNIRQKTELV